MYSLMISLSFSSVERGMSRLFPRTPRFERDGAFFSNSSIYNISRDKRMSRAKTNFFYIFLRSVEQMFADPRESLPVSLPGNRGSPRTFSVKINYIHARALEMSRGTCYIIFGYLSTANPGRVSGPPKKRQVFRTMIIILKEIPLRSFWNSNRNCPKYPVRINLFQSRPKG